MRGMGLGMLEMWEMRGILGGNVGNAGNGGNQVGMQGIRVKMRGILLLLLLIYFSLALQMVHKIINYNMTN